MNNTTNFQIKKSIKLILACTLVILSGCGDSDPVPPSNEAELITTVRITFQPATGSNVVMTYYDEDGGDGTIPPVVTGGELQSNTQYTTTLEILNESVTPPEDITEEILEEDEDHQFFFEISNNLNLTFTYDDVDGNGNPIGVGTIFSTGNASSGTMKVILRHEPDKSAAGVSSGDITNAAGETDVETIPAFDVAIVD